MDLESQIKQQRSKETELKNNIKALNLDIERTDQNCEQLKNKAKRTQDRIDTDNRD